MLKKHRFLLLAGFALVAAMALLAFLVLRKPVTLQVDGQPRTIYTWSMTVGGALKSAGLAVTEHDRLEPPAPAALRRGMVIQLERARPVTVYLQGVPLRFFSGERLVSALLARAGVPLAPDDQIYMDGQRVLPDLTLPPSAQVTLQVRKSIEIVLHADGQDHWIRSSAPTLAEALWGAGFRLNPGDRLSLDPASPLLPQMEVTLERAFPVTIQVGEREIHTRTVAQTAGEVLAEAGIALQGLDTSDPAEDQRIAPGSQIRVRRVREEVLLTQTLIPFTSQYQPDPDTDLDQKRVIEAGQPGIKVTRERVRFEDGQEVGRVTEAEWQASEPKAQIIGTGTRASVKTMDTPDGPIEYYRAVNVYATSYSPCRQGMGKCSKSTSSGIPLTKGIVAVTLRWYNQMAGQRIYVPGYGFGTIGDVGGGIPGTYWIDLGYDEENFINWHQNVTVYFLTPVPANVPGVLP